MAEHTEVIGASNQTNIDSGESETYNDERKIASPQGDEVAENGEGDSKPKACDEKLEKPISIFPEDTEITELQRLFEDVKNMPVAIYSISGALRQGKSFLLNLFIKYLEKLEKGKVKSGDATWINAKNKDFGGFSWRGGMEPDTQGIRIYSKPFVIQDAKGRKVAVFLMDTQGLFDSETSPTECSSIFALSTLISSMQIYNLSQQIQEDNLQYLQLFTDYGRALQQTSTLKENKQPFQNLLFLIRDWPNLSEAYGFEAGQKVLDKVLAVKEGASEDLTSVRKHIRASFETVQCFLMPYPGKEIAERKDGDNKFDHQKMDKEFKKILDLLVRDLFSPKTLALKQIGGKEATGEDMIKLISGSLHDFNSKTAPHIGTLFQSAAEQTATKTLTECDEFCRQQWNALKDTNPYMEDKAIDEKGKEIEEKVLEHFRNYVLLGGESFKDSLQKKLKNKLNRDMLMFKQENQQNMTKQIELYEKHVEEAAQEFKNKLQEKTIKVELFDHETKHHVKFQNEILKKFDEENEGKMKDKFRGRLEDKMQQIFVEMSHNNLLKQINIKHMMEELVQTSLKQFKNEMQQQNIPETDRSRFKEVFEAASKSAFKKFDEESKKYDKTFCENYRNELQRRIKEYGDLNKAEFDAKNEQQRIIFLENIKKAQNKYKNFDKIGKNAFLSEEELLAFHKKSKETAENFLRECSEWKNAPPSEDKKYFESQLSDFYKNQLKILLYQNQDKKSQVVLELKQSVIKITKEYSRKMDQNETNLSEHEKKHEEALKEALKEFGKSVKNIQHFDAQIDEYRKELRDEIMKQYNHNLHHIMRQQEAAKDKVSNLITKCLQTYTQFMSKRLQKAVPDVQFDDLHEFAFDQAQHRFDNSGFLGYENLAEKQKEKLKEQIQKNKKEFYEANKHKQQMEKKSAVESLQESLHFYRSKMWQVCSSGYIDIETLMKEHNASKKAALNYFEDKSSGKNYQFKDFDRDLDKTIESEWITIQGERRIYKKQAKYEIKERATKLMDSFTRKLQNKLQKLVPNEDLKKFCTDLENETLQEFNKNKPQKLSKSFEKEQNRLETNLKTEFLHAVDINNQNLNEKTNQVEEEGNCIKSNFEDAFDDIFDQYLDDEEMEKRIKKEKQRALEMFEASVQGLPEIMVIRVRDNLNKSMERTVKKINQENAKNLKYLESYAELASKETIKQMSTQNEKILGDQVDVETAQYRASEAVTEAMGIFEDGVENIRNQFNVRKYQQETKAALLKWKEKIIENVRNQKETIKTTFQAANKLAIQHVQEEIAQIDNTQITPQDAELKIDEVVSEAMTKLRKHVASNGVRFNYEQDANNTKKELDKLKQTFLEEVKKATSKKCILTANELAIKHVENDVEKIDVQRSDMKNAEQKMTNSVLEARAKYCEYLQRCDAKQDEQEYESTKHKMEEIKQALLDKVKEATSTRCIQKAKDLAIKHVKDEVAKINVQQSDMENAEQKMTNSFLEARAKYCEYLQTNKVQQDPQEYDKTKQQMEEIKQALLEKVKKSLERQVKDKQRNNGWCVSQ